MKKYFLVFVLAISLCSCLGNRKVQTKPNIIYVLTDDLGYGDISILNQNSKIRTKRFRV